MRQKNLSEKALAMKRAAEGARPQNGPCGSYTEPALISLWPDAGRRLGLSKWSTYAAARTGQIPTLRFGRLIKVPVAALERMLQTGEQPREAR